MTASESRLRDAGYTAVICSRIDILAAKPYILVLSERGVNLRIACTQQIAEAVREHFPTLPDPPIILDALSRATRRSRIAHNILCILLEGDSPSRNIRKQFLARRAQTSLKIRAAVAVSRLFPKMSPRALNRLLGRAIGFWLDNPFPTRHVLAVSHVTTPHLLCARGLDVVTLNESWDHAGGKAAGFPSAAVIAWNEDVGRDWQLLQGAEEVLVGFPVKLAYACEAPPVIVDPSERTLMYGVGTCATELDWYTEELELIEAICIATAEAGWDLVIKPRPAGPQPDLPDFARRYTHVRLGRTTAVLGTRDYFLDPEYNGARLAELRSCSLVVNTITTFGLDAACAGLPVLQLDLRASRVYPSLGRAQQNHHLRRYLLDEPDLCIRPPSTESITASVRDFLSRPDERPRAFRDKLRAWIIADLSASTRVASVVDRLVERLAETSSMGHSWKLGSRREA